MVRDNTSPGCERRRNDGPEGYNFSVEIQCDGARRAALLECAFLEIRQYLNVFGMGIFMISADSIFVRPAVENIL